MCYNVIGELDIPTLNHTQGDTEMNIIKKHINDLSFHPMNEQIYGANEDMSDLKEDIRKSGDVMTLVITPDNVIISGHRRVKACRELVAEGDERFCEVNCEVKEFNSEDEEISYLIRCNHNREKTREQKARESEKLLEVEKALAAERMLSGGKADPVPTLAQGSEENKKGRSRDITAEAVGFKSGQELERSLLAVKKIDELTAQGRSDDAQLIRNELNSGTASAAEKLAKSIDDLSDKDKQSIRQKEVSVNKVTSKPTQKAVKKAKAKPVVTEIADKKVEFPKTADDPDGLGLIIPKKTECFLGTDSPIDGSMDVEAVLCADPRKLADFTQTINYIRDWFFYTSIHNKENLKKFVNKAVTESKETNHYTADFLALVELYHQLDSFNEIVKPIVKDYTDEVEREMKAAAERRKQQDEIAKQKRCEIKEQVRRESMEKSRSMSIAMREAEHKKETANQEDTEDENW